MDFSMDKSPQYNFLNNFERNFFGKQNGLRVTPDEDENKFPSPSPTEGRGKKKIERSLG